MNIRDALKAEPATRRERGGVPCVTPQWRPLTFRCDVNAISITYTPNALDGWYLVGLMSAVALDNLVLTIGGPSAVESLPQQAFSNGLPAGAIIPWGPLDLRTARVLTLAAVAYNVPAGWLTAPIALILSNLPSAPALAP